MRKVNKIKIYAILLITIIKLKHGKKKRLYQVHPFLRSRKSDGEYFRLIEKLETYPEKYFEYLRMSKEYFEYLLKLIEDDIKPSKFNRRKDFISSKEKLLITLRYLATGSNFRAMAFSFLMGHNTISMIVHQTVNAIIKNFNSIVFSSFTEEFWLKEKQKFFDRWNFPNCLGAVDGKHCIRFSPPNSGSLYFNYKKTFSTNLMAVTGADYKFIMVNVGSYGSSSDSSIFYNTQFGKNWINDPSQLALPKLSELPNTDEKTPYFLIGDAAFGLKINLMTPYSGNNLVQKQRIFNYRLSRARRVVENSFGIMAHTWRILLSKIQVNVRNGDKIVLCCCILHNFLRTSIDEMEQKRNQTITTQSNTDQPKVADYPASFGYSIRENLANWMVNKGALSYQWKMIDEEDEDSNDDRIFLN